MAKRAFLLILDSVGVGELPDADEFGDAGSNTLGNIAQLLPQGLRLPTLQSLGLGNIGPIKGVPPVASPKACYGKAAERSPAKDTTLGHWEIAGCIADRPFPLYPQGFPPGLVNEFCRGCGIQGVLGNKTASGTVIIQELGDEHVRTGFPIVYTSADSVLQLAAHEEVIPLERQYEMCRVARRLLTGPHRVGRVIARPFVGRSGAYQRTANRRDFSVEPPGPTLLDRVKSAGLEAIGVGKIGDIFAHQGTTQEIPAHGNDEGMAATLELAKTMKASGLVFINLVDFDMLYGHRNDPQGYASALERFDAWLPLLLESLAPSDLLIITADHGCDPTTPSTDHSREYVPILALGATLRAGVDLGIRESFSDIAATISEFLELGSFGPGRSFLM